MDNKSFSCILSKLRNELDLTQDELSKKLGVSKSTVAMWETGKRLPSPDLYEQIADFFNVDIDYLYGRTTIRQKIKYDPDGTPLFALPDDELKLLDGYRKLNDSGKQEMHKRLRELSQLPDYSEEKLLRSDAG